MTTSASRAAAVTTAGGPATTMADSASTPLPEVVRAVDDFGVKGGGSDDDRRVCDKDGRQRLDAPPGRSEGRRGLWP